MENSDIGLDRIDSANLLLAPANNICQQTFIGNIEDNESKSKIHADTSMLINSNYLKIIFLYHLTLNNEMIAKL